MENHSLVFEHLWLADDDPDDQELFDDAIKQILPLVVLTTIINGEELMDLFHSGKIPDILFLDLNMPCKDGLNCLKEIRANRKLSRLPVIVYSSSFQPNHIDYSYGYGANLYFTKPSSFFELIAGLSNIFKMDWSDPYTVTSQHFINNKFIAFNASKFN